MLCSYPQGEWKPKQIDNPDYKGVWVHPEIDNPEYSADDSIYKFDSISVLGLDLWQVNMLRMLSNQYDLCGIVIVILALKMELGIV